MTYPKIMDAAVPPAQAPPGISGVMGYIGGPRATRVWTLADWLRFQHLAQFPVYVPDLAGDPDAQGRDAVTLARSLGWAANMPAPGTRALIIDLETAISRAFYASIASSVMLGGFVPVAYGSMSTVLENAAEDVIAALWDVIPVIPAGQTLHGLQFEANVAVGGTMVDYSVFDPWLFARGGVGPRRAG